MSPHSLHAQNPHRQGLWMELGSGAAAIRVGCAGCETVTRANGSAGFFRIGGALSDKVLLGAETFGFTDKSFGFLDDDKNTVANCSSLAAIVLWYPWRSHFFIKSGVGIAEGLFTVETAPGDSLKADGLGVGLTFGVGLDIPISRKLSITANAGTFFSAIGDIVLPNRTVDDVIPTTYVFSLGFTLR